jgi:nucleotide-binding universal stress UspA family protein
LERIKEEQMERVLVGVDGSAASHYPLVWASDLAGRLNLELVGVRVFTWPQAELGPDIDASLHDEQRQELEQWCRALSPVDRRPRTMLLDGNPADKLLDAAAKVDADLLVVGGRGTKGPTHVRLGSVTQTLTEHTTVPLAIVSNSDASPVQHVVLGIDGSDASHAAAAFVADLACGLGIGVTAVYAFDRPIDWVPDSDPHSLRHQSELAVRQWVAPIEHAGVDVEIDLDRDIDPVPAIARALDAHPGSVGVVGTGGLAPVTGTRLGRLPLRLVHHTGMPIIVVPTQQT